MEKIMQTLENDSAVVPFPATAADKIADLLAALVEEHQLKGMRWWVHQRLTIKHDEKS